MPQPKLILASKSKARQDMLRAAGFDFDVRSADINERKIESKMVSNGACFEQVALALAKEKALSLSKDDKEIIIGSDQILVFNDKIVSKAENKDVAFERLRSFSGNTHILISSVAVICDSEILWSETSTAQLTMRSFSEEFLGNYIDKAGDALTSCVGCYAIEEIGAQLFEKVEGDYFTVLGMPLYPLIGYLQKEGFGL